MGSRRTMINLTFKSKAKNLEELGNANVLSQATVLPVYRFSVNVFESNKAFIVSSIQQAFNSEEVIVRSSAKNEDTNDVSNAGCFESVLGVSLKSSDKIIEAIETVIGSYNCNHDENEVFVQPMLTNVHMAGVAFTCDVYSLAPYYVINYDESGRTDAITNGSSQASKTYIQFKKSQIDCKDKNIAKLIDVLKEIEYIYSNPFIDVEFAVDSSGELYILQVRPIALKGKTIPCTDLELKLEQGIKKIYKKIEKLQSPHPNLLGSKTPFGVMPDWNPAEIIGIKPRQLALSLYKELVTDNIWAYQRSNYGYRNLRSHPLLISFLGEPFIDVRVDFNSFIPESLNEGIAKKLVEHYLDELSHTPSHHDKIEFEIVHSCYYLNLSEKMKPLLEKGFNENELKRIEFSLLNLTNNIICNKDGLYKKELDKVKILEKKYTETMKSDLSAIEKIYWLTEYCKRYGTLPFAGIARAAFVAVQFLRSFEEIGILSKEEHALFMKSLNTVSKELNSDLHKLSKNNFSKDVFLKTWGHLRPGTYDILSLRYDEAFDSYFSIDKDIVHDTNEFVISHEKMQKIDKVLAESGVKTNAQDIMMFIKQAIEGRESAKFMFTKSLSQILFLVEGLAKRFNISRECASFLDIKTIKNLYSSLDHQDIKDVLEHDIAQNKELYRYTQLLKLPSLIVCPKEVYGFFLEEEEANFITLSRVKSHVVRESSIKKKDVKGKIILIQSADPGYDFLFTKGIAGLITQFGGANSHMAIRCAELGIPAVIGAGEQNFKIWSSANILQVDCANKQVKVLS
jgi:glutamine kinase